MSASHPAAITRGRRVAVFSTTMLHCLPDDARGRPVRKMARVLRPGGPLLIVDFGGPVETSLLAHLRYHRHFDVHEMIPALDAAGSERVGGWNGLPRT